MGIIRFIKIMTRLKLNLAPNLLIVGSFFLSFSLITIAKATNVFDIYNPPDTEEVDQTRTAGSGSRSNCQNPLADNSLILLLPEQELAHQTISSNPSFYLYAKTAPEVPLRFNLVIPQPHANNPIMEETLTIEQPGVYKIALNSDIQLESDQIHLWQIGIACSNNTARLSQVLRGAVKRVPISKKLALQLSVTEDSLEQAKIYARNGIWYEALDSALQKQDDPESVNYVHTLLQNEQINLDFTLIAPKIANHTD